MLPCNNAGEATDPTSDPGEDAAAIARAAVAGRVKGAFHSCGR